MATEKSGCRQKSGVVWWIGCRCVKERKELGWFLDTGVGDGWRAVPVTDQRTQEEGPNQEKSACFRSDLL